MTVNVGLIGTGRIGKLHANNLATRVEGATLLAVADVFEQSVQETAQKHNIPHCTTDYREIIANPDVQAIIICSSTDTHAEIIIAAAEAGKHIFCEKPIDHSLEKVDAALAAVEKAGVKLQIGFNRRFDSNFQRVRQAVESGEVGTPHLMHIISRDPAPPPISYIKVSGGIFLDMTIHDFDMARFLMGSEVEEVYTAGGVMVDQEIGAAGDLDTVMITMKFANGVIGTIDNSRQAVYGYDQRVEVFGSAGSVATQNNYANSAIIQTAKAVQRDLPQHFFLERYTDSFIKEMDAFINALENDAPVAVTGVDGRIPIIMGMAARKSYNENRPVRLDEIASI